MGLHANNVVYGYSLGREVMNKHSDTQSRISAFSGLENFQKDVLASKIKALLYCGNTKKRTYCETSRRYALRTTDDA